MAILCRRLVAVPSKHPVQALGPTEASGISDLFYGHVSFNQHLLRTLDAAAIDFLGDGAFVSIREMPFECATRDS